MPVFRGDPVWFAHEEDGFRAGTIQSVDNAKKCCQVQDLTSKETVEITLDDIGALQKRDDKNTMATDDMSSMPELSDASILHNLRSRYEQDQIYTNIGPILVAVNPYRNLTSTMNENAPGILKTVHKIYDSLLHNRVSHSCVVTGESGAGKTESVRMFVNHLATLSIRKSKSLQQGTAKNSSGSSKSASGSLAEKSQFILQERLIQVSPILESFGNAKTVRNDNSSRFGKWIEIEIDYCSGQPLSANIRNYLLEKSRIVHFGPGERNFHIFYQVLTDEAICNSYGVDPSAPYRILQGKSNVTCTTNDKEGLEELKVAMKVIGMSVEEQAFVFRCICGILLLGNVTFQEPKGENTRCALSPESRSVFMAASNLFGLEADALETCLATKVIGNDHDRILKPYTLAEVHVGVDALIKAIYHSLFEWVTERINLSLDRIADAIESATGRGASYFGRMIESGTIGILDAFGFEIFETNSFEQLCINYCNEKMQLHFNRLIFEQEVIEYDAQGILTPEEKADFTTVPDTNTLTGADGSIARCIKLLEEGHGRGFFALIDDELKVPNGTDQSLLRKLISKHAEHPNFSVPKGKASRTAAGTSSHFTIQHYAGSVTYSIEGFLAKSSDPLPKELQLLCARSEDAFLKASFPTPSEIQEMTKGRKAKKTLGTKFKEQLSYLSSLIFEQSVPHFIRCIKPNDQAAPSLWLGRRVLEQIRYAGLLEASRVRARGFPVRHDFVSFCRSFALLANGISASSSVMQVLHDPKKTPTITREQVLELCRLLEQSDFLENGLYRVGKSKVFLRESLHQKLESRRSDVTLRVLAKAQAIARGVLVRHRMEKTTEALRQLDVALEKKRKHLLIAAIEAVSEACRWNSSLQISTSRKVRKAQECLAWVAKVEALEKALRDAVENQDWNAFCNALDECERKKIDTEEVRWARDLKNKQDAVQGKLSELEKKLRTLAKGPSVRTPKDRRAVKSLVQDILGTISVLEMRQNALESGQAKKNGSNKRAKKITSVIQSAKSVCKKTQHSCAALIIQIMFKQSRNKRLVRQRVGQLSVAVNGLQRAMIDKNERRIEEHLSSLDILGFGIQSREPHYLVKDAVAIRANLRLARLGAINQLERLTKKLSRRIRHREKLLEAEQREEKKANQFQQQQQQQQQALVSQGHSKNTDAPPKKGETHKKDKKEAKDESKEKDKKTKKKRTMGLSIFRNVPTFFQAPSKKNQVRKSELDLLLQAIDKARSHGVDEEHECMKESLSLVARLENLKQLKRGTALRMFSSNSLLSTTSTLTNAGGSQRSMYTNADSEDQPSDENNRSSLQRRSVGTTNGVVCVGPVIEEAEAESAHPVVVDEEDESLDCMLGDCDENCGRDANKPKDGKLPKQRSLASIMNDKMRRTMSVSRLRSRKGSKSQLQPSKGLPPLAATPSNHFSASCQQLVVESKERTGETAHSPTRSLATSSVKSFDTLLKAYGRAPPPPPEGQENLDEIEDRESKDVEDALLEESTTGMSTSMQRAIMDRITREREMRKVIESRYWQHRRGLSGPIASEAVKEYNKDLEKEYSFNSSSSNQSYKTDKQSSFQSQTTIPEGHHRPTASVDSISTSSGSMISRHSTNAYKQHWEAITFVQKNVVSTKLF